MNLREANYEVERLNNRLKKLYKDKELLEVTTDPKSTDYQKIIIDGGKHTSSVQEIYVLKQELTKWKDLDKKICKTQEEIKNYIDWIDKELKILKKYNKIEQLIVYYKEIELKNYTWQDIATLVHYSEPQCRRIYKRYKQTRNILQDDQI